MNPEIFKQVLGCFATGVTVVTLRDAQKAPQGVTVNAFASLSLDPPLILFNLAKTASCYASLTRADAFAINILSEDQPDLSQRFAFTKENTWSGVPFYDGKNHAPILEGVIAAIECRLHTQYDGGDHTIFVGHVTHLEKKSNKKPLLYYRGKYSNVNEII